MKIIKPKRLEKGDTIGIVSPSSPITEFPRRLKRSLKSLENLGFNVVLGKNAKKFLAHNAGTPKERAQDIMDFFEDNNIKAIIASTGGWTSNSVLPLLDYDIIKENPKVFCGYSDITALNVGIYAKTGLVTFNGPTLLPSFGEFGGPFDYTIKWFKRAVMSDKPIGDLDYPEEFTEELLWWEKEDNRRRKMRKASKPFFLTPGIVEGVLVGGDLVTLQSIIGTEFVPDFGNHILFLECEDEATYTIERTLTHFELLGIFEKIKGLIFARPSRLKTYSEERTLYDILREFGMKYKIPVVVDVDFGHTDPRITMPIGIKARLDSDKNKITIIESATV